MNPDQWVTPTTEENCPAIDERSWSSTGDEERTTSGRRPLSESTAQATASSSWARRAASYPAEARSSTAATLSTNPGRTGIPAAIARPRLAALAPTTATPAPAARSSGTTRSEARWSADGVADFEAR
jgi:hypothetical protein